MIEYMVGGFLCGILIGILYRSSQIILWSCVIFAWGYIIGNTDNIRGYVDSLLCIKTIAVWAGMVLGYPFGYLTCDWIAKWFMETI